MMFGLAQCLQPDPHRTAYPIELTPVDDTEYVAPRVIAGIGDTAESDGGYAGLGVGPVIASEICAGSRWDVGSASRGA